MQKFNIINQLVNNENVYNGKMIKVDKVGDVYFKSFDGKKTKKIKVNLIITPKGYSLEKIGSTMQQIVIFYKFVGNDLTHFDTKFKAYFKDVHFPTMQELFSAMEDVIISSKTEETDNGIKVLFHTGYNDYNSGDVVYLSKDNYDEIRNLGEFVVKYKNFERLCKKVKGKKLDEDNENCNNTDNLKIIFYSNLEDYTVGDIECIVLEEFDKLREEDVCMELEKFKYFCMGENKDDIKQEKEIKFLPLETNRKNKTTGKLIELSHGFEGAEVKFKDGSIGIYVLFKNDNGDIVGDVIGVYNHNNNNLTKEDIIKDFEEQVYKNYEKIKNVKNMMEI